jgi:hypothetical protein
MIKPINAKTPQEYIAAIDEPRKADIKELDKFIRKTVPKLKSFMISGMIGYGNYHYKYVSGREGDWCVIGLASQKNYISVYACATKNGKYVPEMYKKDLPKARIGKSCIRFKKVSDVSLDVIKKILLESEVASKEMTQLNK